ncbi:hypothetical protein QUF58_11510 [Anaerolineales bacterium HSG24]|nr:hypothetical protein [Anaerolineales bacterium HSG24]
MNDETPEMGRFIAILTLSLTFLLGYAVPALFGAWVLTLILPYSFSQVMWLTLGVIVALSFVMLDASQTITPGGFDILHIIITIIISYIFLTISALLGWLSTYLPIDVSLFELTALFAISLVTGSSILVKALITENFDDSPDKLLNHIETVSHKSKRRKRRSK